MFVSEDRFRYKQQISDALYASIRATALLAIAWSPALVFYKDRLVLLFAFANLLFLIWFAYLLKLRLISEVRVGRAGITASRRGNMHEKLPLVDVSAIRNVTASFNVHGERLEYWAAAPHRPRMASTTRMNHVVLFNDTIDGLPHLLDLVNQHVREHHIEVLDGRGSPAVHRG